MEQVSVVFKTLDLYAPKFGLDSFGSMGEKVILRITLSRSPGQTILYGSYTIGSGHAQVTADQLVSAERTVTVASVSRLDLGSAVSEIGSLIQPRRNLEFMMAGKDLLAEIDSRKFPVTLKRVYTVGGRLYLQIQFLGKRLKIALGGDHANLYDSSNREVADLVIVGNRLTVKRKFQHPELVE